jgi:hypothetical protein
MEILPENTRGFVDVPVKSRAAGRAMGWTGKDSPAFEVVSAKGKSK